MLLIRPFPQTADLLPSYLLRLTAANGYKNPMQLLRSDGYKLANNRLPGKKIFFGDFDLDRVAFLANINISQVEELRLQQANNTRCFTQKQQFLTRNINFSHVRVCPACYEELKTIPFTSSLEAKTFCTKHNYPLVHIHPVTGYRLTWGTHYLWRDATSWQDEKLTIDIGEAEFNINQQIESLESRPLIIGRLSFCLAEYCDLLAFFAHFHQFAFGRKYTTSARNDLEFCRQYYSPAYWYITEWPARFFQLLEHFEDNPMSDNRLTGIRKCFRDLYDDIYSPNNSRSKAYVLLKNGFTEYLRDHFSHGMLMRSLSLIDPKAKKLSTFISDTQVAKLLCRTLSKVKVYVREKLLSPSHYLLNGTRLFLRADVLKLKARLRSCCSITECSELLGISVYHTRQLLRANIIPTLLKPNLDNRDWLIEKMHIEQLVNRLKVTAIPSTENLITAKKRFAFAGYNLANVIQHMLSDKIKFTYTDSKNAPYSIEQFTPILRIYDAASDDLLTPKEACLVLGINKNVIYDFIKIGLLNCITQKVNRTPRPIKLIPKFSINQFKSSYLLRHQLKGPQLHTLENISGPKIDGGIINVYQSKL